MRKRFTSGLGGRRYSALAILIIVAPSPARAHFVGAHEAQLRGSIAEAEDFGTAVAMDATGSRAFFGAPEHGAGDGRVRVFVRTATSWAIEADVAATATGTRFGTSIDVSADGTRMIVGAPAGSDGSAHVLVRAGAAWTEEAGLAPSSPLTGGAFGASVAMSPDGAWAIVGSPGAGVAEVFSRTGSTWASAGVVASATEGAAEQLGYSVAVDATGTRVCVGAHAASVSGVEQAGTALVFRRDSGAWVEEGRFTDPAPVHFGLFGRSVAMDETGTRVLIGGYFSRAHVFTRAGTSWTHEVSLLSILLAGYQGAYVSLDAAGSHAIVGLPSQDYSGRVHTFARSGTTWSADGSIRGLGGITLEGFGAAVAMSGDATRLAVGAPDAPISGVGYVFASVGEPCVDGSTCPTGICADGICCDSSCTDTCVSCAAAETGADFDGLCDTYSSAVARTVLCRAATGVCDEEETCVPWSPVCPSDGYARATLCRASAGACDLYEYCDGTGPECPPDARAVGTTCRPSAGACDPAEVCDGVSAGCPANVVEPTGTTCRASSDPSCDPEELCDGTSARCPSDVDACVADAGVADAGIDGGPGIDDAGASIDDAGASIDDAGASIGDAGASIDDAGAGLDDAGASIDDAGVTGLDDAGVTELDGGIDDASSEGLDAAAATDGGSPDATGGCSCRVFPFSKPTGPPLALLLAALGLLLVARRRVRRADRARRRPGASSASIVARSRSDRPAGWRATPGVIPAAVRRRSAHR